MRIIVSSVNSPLYPLSIFLYQIIHSSIPHSRSFILNSSDLVNKLKNITIKSNYQLASLDVVSLFTNVLIQAAVNSIKKRWTLISKNTNVPLKEFLLAVNLVLDSSYFAFDNVIYKQIFGTPMGSPLSPIIADLVMQDLENDSIARLSFSLPVLYRYVDDILLVAQNGTFDLIMETFNSWHERLQFTLELSTNNIINFLNLQVIIENNSF